MYKRCVKPLVMFLSDGNKPGKYYIDCQFGRVGFASKRVAGAMNTRTDASGATFIVEIKRGSDGKEEG